MNDPNAWQGLELEAGIQDPMSVTGWFRPVDTSRCSCIVTRSFAAVQMDALREPPLCLCSEPAAASAIM